MTEPRKALGLDDPRMWGLFQKGVRDRLAWLARFQRALREVATKAKPAVTNAQPTGSGQVFIVHGHDELIREKVARFIEKLGLEPVILHERPNKGNTLLEKFLANAQVGYAVVLLTPDDLGKAKAASELNPRARQNVVLELGYFLGALTRSRVCALHTPGIELPSDLQGLVYVPLDAGDAWKLLLAREMKAAGLGFDLNRAVQ